MASTRLEFFENLTGWSSTGRFEVALEQLTKLDRIVTALKENPLAPWIRIFGSAANEVDLIPGDIDAFVELDLVDLPKGIRHLAINQFLLLAVEGGYHGNYGMFDPFLLDKNRKLFTRNEGTSRYSTGWIAAEKQIAIAKAGRGGIPVLDFCRKFATEFGSVATQKENLSQETNVSSSFR